MKNILNKIGAVSKPVIFGAALGVATVAVGVGVATNLMSDGVFFKVPWAVMTLIQKKLWKRK